MKKVITLAFLLISGLLVNSLFGCATNEAEAIKVYEHPTVNFSNIRTIPITDSGDGWSAIVLSNSTNYELNNPDIKIINPNNDNLSVEVDSSKCASIGAGQSCLVFMNLHQAQGAGYFIVEANITNQGSNSPVRQIVSYAKLQAKDDIIVDSENINLTAVADNQASLAIPYYSLDKNSTLPVTSSNKSLLYSTKNVCNPNNSRSCTEIITFNSIQDAEVYTKLKSSTLQSILSTNSVANLIMSQTGQILQLGKSGEETKVITLINSGLDSANYVTISSSNLAVIKVESSTCTGTLLPNGSCSFRVSSPSTAIANAQIVVSYQDGVTLKQLYSNFAVIPANLSSTGLTISYSNDLQSSIVGESKTLVFTATNSGNVSLFNVKFARLVDQVTTGQQLSYNDNGLANSCLTKTTLVVGGSCSINLVYNPTQKNLGILEGYFTAQYKDIRNNDITISSSKLLVPYTANPRIVLVGDAMASTGVAKACNYSESALFCTKATDTNSGQGPSGLANLMINNVFYTYFASWSPTTTSRIYRCIVDQSTGVFSSCTDQSSKITVGNSNILFNDVAVINNKYYMYFPNYNNGNISKCSINESDGSINSCTALSNPYWNYSIRIIGNTYAVITLANDGGYGNPRICDLNSTGDFTNCVSTGSNDTVNLGLNGMFSSAYIQLNGQGYLYFSGGGQYSGNNGIKRCKFYPPKKELYSCTVLDSSRASLRDARIINVNGTNYLYYTSINTSGNSAIYRRLINNDGSLGSETTIALKNATGSATFNSTPQGIYPAIIYPSASLFYFSESDHTYIPGQNKGESLVWVSNSILNNTTVTLNAPSGISVTPNSLTFSNTTRAYALKISVANPMLAGNYTITGTATNGVLVPVYSLTVPRPAITSTLPNDQFGIGGLGSLSPNLSIKPKLNFNLAMESVAITNKNNVRLQIATDVTNTNFVDVPVANYSLSLSTDGKTLTISPNAYLISGTAYRIWINPTALKDIYGNSMDPTTSNIALTFRPALKIFVTTGYWQGNMGGDGANNNCNGDGNNPDNTSTYRALIGDSGRYPSSSYWVLEASTNYYRRDGNTLIATTTGDRKLPNSLQNSVSGEDKKVWSGFDSNWNIPSGSFGANWACTNWSSSGVLVAGTLAKANDTGTRGWSGGNNANGDLADFCNKAYSLYCVQQP